MDQRPLQADPALASAAYQLAVTQQSNFLPAKENSEGTPRSPLTENSITSSQESVTAEFFEQSQARSIWAMSTRHQCLESEFMDLSTASPGGVAIERSRSNNLALPFAEMPSPSIIIQEKIRSSQRGRFPQGGFSPHDHFHPQHHLHQQHSQTRRGNSSYRHLFKQVTKVGSGQSLVEMGIHEATLTVEHLVAMVKNFPGNQPVFPAVAPGLHFMDSRAVAALLKDVAKNGLPQRAIEIFDCLRNLPQTHELHNLCDVYTYTTVIALCGQRQSLRLALELVAEMRSRGVTCNVHTYSALMNTCIKCGELELALDVFHQLQKEGCVANVVTFNTLVDVYGKLGRWEDAIRVIDQVYLAGLEPEARTFNTVIIAANICNQPLEALKVYKRMIASGFRPTDTTYTALISAYGKAGQLEHAMEVFEQMVHQKCERNIITYGSLIAACEKAGEWELALRLLEEMRRDGVPPNTMTFNALLSACAQGGKSEKAEALFHSMLSRRCKPDASAYNSVLLAHIRAGHWRAGLQALDLMPAGSKPDPTLYAGLIQCLWDSGMVAAQAQAVKLFGIGCRSGSIPPVLQQNSEEDRTLEVKISAPSSSIAVLGLLKWLRETLEFLDSKADPFMGQTKCLLTANNNLEPGPAAGEPGVQAQEILNSVLIVLAGLQSPFRPEDVSQRGGKLVADTWRVVEWLQKDDVKNAIADYLPAIPQDARSVYDSFAHRTIAAQEAASNARLADSHLLFCQAENNQKARLASAQTLYLGSRDGCLQLANKLADRCSISAEAVYTGMILMDCALCAGLPFSLAGAAMLVAACLSIAVHMCTAAVKPISQQHSGMEATLNLPPGSLLPVVEQLQQIGISDLPVATPITILNHYLQQLTHANNMEHVKPEARPVNARVTGGSKQILAAAMADPSTQHIQPSLLAAAALAVDRKSRGLVPIWPTSLARWTGLSAAAAGAKEGVFDVAIQLVAAVPLPSA